MSLPFLLKRPRLVHWAVRLDTAPTWLWPALLLAALWPSWVWMARRMSDGSDDPLGLVAVSALACLLALHRKRLRAAPRLKVLLLALGGALVAALLSGPWAGSVPALAVALISVLSLAAGLVAFLPAGVASGPVLGLAVLALPLLASLQFYLGFPLRVIAATASQWLLQGAFAVERSGASLVVDGQLILVDAPCSGVQMVWLGYFSACAAALYAGRSSRSFFARLPAVGVLVLAANVLRNTALIGLQASGVGLHGWAHDALGLGVLAVGCSGVAWVMTFRGEK